MFNYDTNGNLDICRAMPPSAPLPLDTQKQITTLKLNSNADIAKLRILYEQQANVEIKRHLSLAATCIEEGTMWAAKAMSSEGWQA